MLPIKHLDGRVEGLTDVTMEHVEELNGELSLRLTSYRSDRNAGYELLQEESIVTYENRDYRIKGLEANKDYKTADAISIYFDNADVWQYDTFAGLRSLNGFLDFALAGTGWTYTNMDVTGSKFIANFGNANVLTLINHLLISFDCDMKIGEGKTLIFAQDMGVDDDFQYRYGNNIVALSQTIDTTKLKTFVKGFGGDGLQVSYTSPNASVFGIRHAEPIYDDRFTVSENLVEHIASQLIDYPEVSIELEAVELQDKNVGDYVWLIYEPLNIEFQTQVLKKVSRVPKELSTVTIGNSTAKGLSDSLVKQNIDISENQSQTRSKFEQTNEEISLSVERIEGIDGRLGMAEAAIVVNADNIELKVSEEDYNGNEIASRFNMTSTTIELDGQKINLIGAVSVLSDITGELGTMTTGKIITLQIDGPNKQIFFGADEANFQGRIDYLDGSMRFQRDSSTYLKINAGGPDGGQATGTSSAALLQMYGAGSPIFNFGIMEEFNHRTINGGKIRLKLLNGDVEALQVRDTLDFAYRPIHASEFTVSSLRATKKNIEPYEVDALHEVNTTFVHRYHLLEESDNEVKRIGLIYDEVPADIASISGAGVDMYSMVSILWKAVQQLSAKVEALESQQPVQ